MFKIPLAFDFDIVIHSATKYLNGHSDLIGGVVICSQGKPELAEQLLYLQNAVAVSYTHLTLPTTR